MISVKDISNEEYHASDGISRSGLMEFKRSPYHYWYKYINPDYIKEEESFPLIFGGALHTYVLEKERFHDAYAILPSNIDRRTKDGKANYENFLIKSSGKVVISADTLNKIKRIDENVSRNPQALGLVTNAQIEKSIYWQDEETGILCKVRPDIWHSNMVVDLKSTSNASPREFQKSIYKYGYHIQAGMIHEAMKALGEPITSFLFLAVEKDEPYSNVIYILDDEALQFGVSEFKSLLQRFSDCKNGNNWPAYEAQVLSLPGYIKSEVTL